MSGDTTNGSGEHGRDRWRGLLPSAGFFGGTAMDYLRIRVGTSIRSVLLELEEDRQTYLNLRGLQLLASGKSVDVPAHDSRVTASSSRGDAPADLLLARKGFHSMKEARPWWRLDFAEPVAVDEIRVFNRTDRWGVRSRRLRVSCIDSESEEFRCLHRLDPEEALAGLSAALAPLGAEGIAHDLSSPADDVRRDIIGRIATMARRGEPLPPSREWLHLVPLLDLWSEAEPSADEWTMLAAWLLVQRKENRKCSTSIKALSAVLGTRARLARLQVELDALHKAFRLRPQVISRHGVGALGGLRLHARRHLAAMRRIFDALEASGREPVLAYGTLLGAVREGRFLAHDDDIDLLYRARAGGQAEACEEVRALAHELESCGFQVETLLPKFMNLHVKDPATGTSVDLFPWWRQDDMAMLHMESMKIRGIPLEGLEQRGESVLEGIAFPAPLRPERFLEMRYGERWRIADPFYNWPWPLKDAKAAPNDPASAAKRGAGSTGRVGGRKMEKDMLKTQDGKILVHWWTHAPNFGDLLAPWLVAKMSGREVEFAPKHTPGYVVIGSILSHVTEGCVVWGAGSFGTETPSQICKKATYLAVRGPLTRNKLDNLKIPCPRVYGDPALLVPDYYRPEIEPVHEVGIVLRWSETERNDKMDIPGVKKIFLGSDDIEGTIDDMLSCKRIVSSSLHGLILADAYGIPNAWLDSPTPKGKEFKYWDYLISVDKPRPAKAYKLVQPGLTADRLISDLHFDDRPIGIDLDLLRDACPFKA